MSQFQNPLLLLKCDEVVMYDYIPTSENYKKLIVDADFKLAPDTTIKKSVRLDDLTAEKLTFLLGDVASYGDEVMRCLIPHLAFVYFHKGKIVFHASICLTCNDLRTSIEIPAHNIGRGLSKSFRTFLNSLLDANGFSNNVRLDNNLREL